MSSNRVFFLEAKQPPIKPECSCFRHDFPRCKVLDCIAVAEANPPILEYGIFGVKGRIIES